MHPFPHRYTVAAVADAGSEVTLESQGLPFLRSALPAEFGGAGDKWSPETLLVAAVADCYALTFRGVAAASRFPWTSMTCRVVGTLDRLDRVTRFTAFDIHAHLEIPESTGRDQALRLLARAEETCLITRSLTAAIHLDARVETVETAVV
jgi:organic hydroperoxide reductase OsmC/OhrA